MLTSAIWFGATFLIIFPPCLALSRVIAQNARKKEDRRFWEEGERRRAEAAAEEAWQVNRETNLR